MSKCSIYERIFNRFDEDGDGKLSPSELRRFVETMGVELLMEEAQELVASLELLTEMGCWGWRNLWSGWRERSEGMKRERWRS